MKKFMAEFKEFAVKGNVIDLAIGVIIGGAFSGLTSSLVEMVIMPIVGLFIGGLDLSTWVINIPNFIYGGDPVAWQIGAFITSVINFIILALVVFFIVKVINRMKRKEEAKEEAPAAPPEPTKEELLLAEIRDILKDK